jgi:hypothetical protein
MAGHCPEKDRTVKKIENKKIDAARDEVAYDWKDLVEALRDVIDGALNAAGKIASYEEEWEAIENLRDFVHDWLAGRRAYVKVNDVMIALGVILSEIELDLGIDSAELLEPLRAMVEVSSRLPAFIYLPGADDIPKPPVVIRRAPRRRNCAEGFTALAA